MDTDRFKHKEITDIILKSFYEVYNELGDGFLESVYENALYIVLTEYGLYVERQKDISVFFRGTIIGNFKADLIVDQKVIVELKAVRTLDSAHEAQLINYLKATNIEVGLLLNFGRKPEFKRFVYDNKRKKISVNQRKPARRLAGGSAAE
ncbi:MAG: GxxExxY protein [Deltaproteobacteria bacterium]|nr:GxxExxY protein [Deltaproteobacteria bacterium]